MKKILFIVVALLAMSAVSYGATYTVLHDNEAGDGNVWYWTAANGATLSAQSTYGVTDGTYAMQVDLDSTQGGNDFGKLDKNGPTWDFSLYDTIEMDVTIIDSEWDTGVDLANMTISTEGGGQWIGFSATGDTTWADGDGDETLHLTWDIASYDVDGLGWGSLRWNPSYADAGVGNLYIDDMKFQDVPEPMTIGLLGLGGLFLRRRRA